MEITRRSALRLSSTALTVGIAGCTTSSTPESDDSTTTTAQSTTSANTSTSTDSQSETPSLTFSANVLQQPSPDAPARVAAQLKNTGEQTVDIGFGPALLFTDNGSDDLDWATDLVLVADTYTGPNDEPSEPTNGCWRFPEDGYVAIQSSLEFRKLAPGTSLTERYSVYTRGDSRPCLPQGTYRFQDKGYLQQESRPLILTLILTINENQQVSATTEEPQITST